MNYYPFHLGDYTAHTAHLEPLEDLAYRRMLDLYYLRETPLPKEPAEVARLIRMRQNAAEVEAVLREFFTLTDDGWTNERCDEEIGRMREKQEKAKASAAASVRARKAKAEHQPSDGEANAKRTLSERSTDDELPTPTPTPTPTPIPSSTSSEGVDSAAPLFAAAPAELPPPEVSIPLIDGTDFGVTQAQIDEWQETFPAVNVLQQLREMRAWCIANPANRKTAKGVARFIVSWLGKEQDRAPRVAAGRPPTGARHPERTYRPEDYGPAGARRI